MPKTVWLGRNRTVALDRFIFLVFLVTYSITYITSVNHCLWFCFFYCYYGFLSMPNSVLGHWSFRTFECVFIFLQHSPPPQWACWFHLHVKCRRVFRHRYTGRCFSGWICKVWSMFLFTTLFVCLFVCYPDHVAYNNFTDSLFYIVFMKSFISDKESMTPSSINDCWKKLWLSGMFIKVRKLMIFANKSIHFVDTDKLFKYTNLVIFFFPL